MRMEKWICLDCGTNFEEPENKSKDLISCPNCWGQSVKRAEYCMVDGCMNWKRVDRWCCNECRKKNVMAIKEFAKRFDVPTLRDMDEILEGNALEDFK